MDSERKYEPIKLHRGWYYVEYKPPENKSKYSYINIVILEDQGKKSVINAVETEINFWLKKYPTPVFATAFTDFDDVYSLKGEKEIDNAIGFVNKEGQTNIYWRLIENNQIPDVALNSAFINNLFENIPYKTKEEIHQSNIKKRKEIKAGLYIFIFWLAIIPAIIAIMEYCNDFLSLIALLYSLYKAFRKGLELFGKWPKSKKMIADEEKRRKMEHYYYHCEMNPDAFTKLKFENFNKLAQEKTITESNSIIQKAR